MHIKGSKLRILFLVLMALILVVSSFSTVFALSSVGHNVEEPDDPDDGGGGSNIRYGKNISSSSGGSLSSGFNIEDWEGIISIDVETDKYRDKDTKSLVDKVNDGDTMSHIDYIKELPAVKGKSNPTAFPTTQNYDINLELYERVTPFYDIRYHRPGHNSNVAPGRAEMQIPGCEGMDGSDLLVLIIDEKTGEMYLVPPIAFDSQHSIMTLDLPCVGPYCILHKIPIVVRNVDPELYPNKELANIIEAMPDNEIIECKQFLIDTEAEEYNQLEVSENKTINTEDYSSAIALSDVAVRLGEDEDGEEEFSYDLVTKFKANLYRANDKVDWERILKYSKVKYDRDEIIADDKELTEIDPIKLKKCFVYHIDAVTREVSIIYEPEICWSTYGELSEDKRLEICDSEKSDSDISDASIQYFDVDDIDGQQLEEKKLKLDEQAAEDEESAALNSLTTEVYAADLNLDEVDEYYNQTYDEDDVCIVINGDAYLGMGPFLLFMPKKIPHFPWWILLILLLMLYLAYRYKKKKDEERAKSESGHGNHHHHHHHHHHSSHQHSREYAENIE